MAEAINAPRVLVLGASSQIGWFAVPLLAARGYRVQAISRGGRPRGFPELAGVDWRAPAAVGQANTDLKYLLSLGPLELAIDGLSRCAVTRSVSAISTSSIDTKLDSPDAGEAAQVGAIMQHEQDLADACRAGGLDCTIIRPTLVYGCGLDTNISRLYRFIRRFGFIPVASNARGLRQPIHAQDLALAAVLALENPVTPGTPQPLCGGSRLTYTDMLLRLFQAAGKKPRLVRVPQQGLAAIVQLASFCLPGFNGNREMVARQSRDLVFDDALVRQALQLNPRAFAPSGRDFLLPDPAAIRQWASQPD